MVPLIEMNSADECPAANEDIRCFASTNCSWANLGFKLIVKANGSSSFLLRISLCSLLDILCSVATRATWSLGFVLPALVVNCHHQPLECPYL